MAWNALPLAQSGGGGGNVGGLFFWLFVLIGLILIAAAGVMYLRKWYGQADGGAGAGFTLGDIRALHRSGQMTDEEFERARELIIGRAKAEAKDTRTLRDGRKNDAGPTGVEVKDG